MAIRQPQQRQATSPATKTLWGRLGVGHLSKTVKRAAMGQKAPPLIQAPTQRPLTTKDALYTVDAATGQRMYRMLAVAGVPGRWAGREWQHCGAWDRVMLVAWAERDNLMAEQHGCVLVHGAVCVVEGGQAA